LSQLSDIERYELQELVAAEIRRTRERLKAHAIVPGVAPRRVKDLRQQKIDFLQSVYDKLELVIWF
jgi:hypothetical protein